MQFIKLFLKERISLENTVCLKGEKIILSSEGF